MKDILKKRNPPINRKEGEFRKRLSESDLFICSQSLMHLARRSLRGRSQGQQSGPALGDHATQAGIEG
jgi:hypothetical protein